MSVVPPPRRVLLIRPDSYGDLVLFAPALAALRQAWPEAQLCLLVRRGYEDLAPLVPVSGLEWKTVGVHPYNHLPSAAQPAIGVLRRELTDWGAPDLIVAASWTRTWLEPLVAGFFEPGRAREVGFNSLPLSAEATADLRNHFGIDPDAHYPETVPMPPDTLEWEKNLRLADTLVGHPVPRRRPRLHVPANAARQAVNILRKLGLGTTQPWAACCPVGTANVPIKAWREEGFAETIAWLRETHGLPTLLVGHRGEAERVERVAALAAERGAACPVWLGEDGEMPLLAGLLKKARIFFGNDTGTLHLAAGLDRPLVALYGGGHWPRFQPVARRATVLHHPLPCYGCGWHCHFGDAPCVKNVPAALVQDALGRLLAEKDEGRGMKDEGPESGTTAEASSLHPSTTASVEVCPAGSFEENSRALLGRLLVSLSEKENVIQNQLAALATGGQELFAARAHLDELRGELDASRAELHRRDGALEETHARFRETHAQLVDAHTRVGEAQGRMAETRARAESLHAQLADAQATLHAARDEADALRRAHEQLCIGADAVQRRERRRRRLLSWRGRQLRRTRARLDAAATRIEELDAVARHAGGGLDAAAARMAELDTQARTLGAQVDALDGLLRERDERIVALDARARDLDTKARDLRAMTLREVAAERMLRTVSGFVRKRIVRYFHSDERRPRPAPLPRITLVTPVFNAADTLAETLESVLGQDYPNLEYLVVDGGSADGSRELIERYRDRLAGVVLEPDEGMYDALAEGFAGATGEVFGYLNADDLLEPGGLRRVGEFFRTNPRAAVLYHEDTVEVGGWRFPNVAQPSRVDFGRMLAGHNLFQDGVFFRRAAYEAIGGLNRKLRLAGDWELWTRLAGRYRFHRGASHVSCFRVRAGQLSSDMDRYRAEQAAVTPDLRRAAAPPWPRRWVDWATRQAGDLSDWWGRVWGGGQRLLYPIPFNEMPPPPGTPPPPRGAAARIPRCPVTGQPADRLLFSSRDTRFGDRRIHRVYACTASGVAVSDPPLGAETLGALYAEHYSNPTPRVLPPEPGSGSPYRWFRGGSPFDRLALRMRLDEKAAGRLGVSWGDKTGDELLVILRGLVRPEDEAMTFLDVGCFEGHLLDELKRRTRWQLSGLEPNAAAAESARTRGGHEVWVAPAEAAAGVIPPPRSFGVIFLGQTIEHLDEPMPIVRRLATLLAPGGFLVMSTPNLDSRQIDLFGPTWSHWHPPYHRALYSPRGLELLGRGAGLRAVRSRSHSHPYWSALSLQLHALGLGGAVPHGLETPAEVRPAALGLAAWSRWVWDWRGQGDYFFTVFRRA